MKKKTTKLIHFIEGLHKFISIRSNLVDKASITSKVDFQNIIVRLILEYLEQYFVKDGYKNSITKSNDALSWEVKELQEYESQSPVFGELIYPDFIINDPYLIAIVCKEGNNGSVLKQGIGESLIYTLSGEFDFVYFLFIDQTQDKKIERSIDYKLESSIVSEMWDRYNIFFKIV